MERSFKNVRVYQLAFTIKPSEIVSNGKRTLLNVKIVTCDKAS